MISPKLVVVDPIGLIVILACPSQRRDRQDHLPWSSRSTSLTTPDCKLGTFCCAILPSLSPVHPDINACCSLGKRWVEYKYCTSRSVGKYNDGWVIDYLNETCSESLSSIQKTHTRAVPCFSVRDCNPADGALCIGPERSDSTAPI